MAFKSVITDSRFWAAAVERAVFTGAQSFAAAIGVFSVEDISKLHINGLPWAAILSITAVAMLASFATSVAKGGAVGAPGLAERLRVPADNYTGPIQDTARGDSKTEN